MDKHLESLLKKLYERFETKPSFSVCGPEYQREEIDALAAKGLIDKLYSGDLSDWAYEVSPTHAGKTYFQNKKAYKKQRRRHLAFEWIKFLIPVLITSVR